MPTVLLMLAAFAASPGLDVAATGNDENPGTSAAPFATVTRARDAIRAMKKEDGLPKDGITVWIHEGAYEFSESFTLTDEDSGTTEAPIVYSAAPGEEVRLSGGREIPVEAFKPVAPQAAAARLPEEAQTHVLCADLAGLGIAEYGAFPDQFTAPPMLLELFFNDTRMPLARWPNEGWAEIAQVIESGPAPWRGHESDQLGTFEYAGDRPARWVDAPAVWLEGYWCFDWRSEFIRAQAIDPERQRVTLAKQHVYGLGSGNPGPRRYYAVNLLEELDLPGEHYVDRETGMLYFWPPAPLEGSHVTVTMLTDPVFSLRDAAFVTLRGLIFEQCRGTALKIEGGQDNQVLACTLRNTGNEGIVVSGGARHRIEGCEIHDTGTRGVVLEGGDRKTLSPAHHEAVNNHIYRFSRRQRTYAPAISLAGVGNRVAHNLLHDAPHMAIGLSGNDHVIELNEIHHVTLETDDCGAFYMGRNPSHRGNVLRYNYWHHVGAPFGHGNNAVYFDDGDGGQTVFGNVFYRCGNPGKSSMGAVFCHGGHGNLVENNIFIECKRAIGAAPWNDKHWGEWINGELWQARLLEEVDITQPPYTERYPELDGFMTPSGAPRMNRAVRNIAVNCDAFLSGNYEEEDNLLLQEDPGFVDAAAMNFQLREDAIAFERIPGFKAIPFQKIGLLRKQEGVEAAGAPASWERLRPAQETIIAE